MKKSQMQKFPLRKGQPAKSEERKDVDADKKVKVETPRIGQVGTGWKSPWNVGKTHQSEGSQGIKPAKEGGKLDAQLVKRRVPTSLQQKKAVPTPPVGLKTAPRNRGQPSDKGDEGEETTTSIETSEVSSQPSEKEEQSEPTSEEISEPVLIEIEKKEESDRDETLEKAANEVEKDLVLDEVHNVESSLQKPDIVSEDDSKTEEDSLNETEIEGKSSGNLSLASDTSSGSVSSESETEEEGGGEAGEESDGPKEETEEPDKICDKPVEVEEESAQMEEIIDLEKQKEEAFKECATLEDEIVDLRAQNEELRQEVVRLMKCLLEKTALLVKYRGAVDELGARVKQLLRKAEDEDQDSSDDLDEDFSDSSS